MKKLLVFLKDYKKETVLAPLFKMLEAGFELFVPLVMAAVIDRGIAASDTAYVFRMGFVLVLLGIIGLTCSITAQYFAAKAAVGFSTQLKHALFKHIQELSFSEIDTLGTSTMITRMTSDANQVQNGVNMVLRLFLRSPFIVFGAMIMAFTIDVKAALVFVVAIPLLSIVVFGIMMITMPLYKKVQAGLDKILGKTRENLTGVRVIRAFHKEAEETEEFEQSNHMLTHMQLFVGKISALTNPVTYIIVNVATIALIYTGAVRVDTGYITQGEVVALVNYMSQILIELVKLANLIITITKALACANRIENIFELRSAMEWKNEAASSVTESEYAVEFEHVCLTYQGAGAESLSDIDFRVKKGETIGIIGGTGSGKSSLVHLIPRFYDATKGTVKIAGRDVKDYGMKELRDKVGIVMQKAVLFQGSIEENLRWGKQEASMEDITEALQISQAKEFVDEKPNGIKEPIAQGGKNLSGGQRQRLTIARAVIKKPEILILDDSASALDYATDARLRKALRGMEKTTTTFIVSQRTSSIQHADKVIVLEDGKVAGIGTHEQLLENCEVYKEIYYSQA
ncbi:MAG: ABC transporter ATP-binding protein/permease [Bacillus sp. (in: Bacteria)]|nr:ABC transporter ATP-binding protein/permease [Bacillus sp. (in: firmicutes)]MCM1425711.1 ABC transporter ATP-binding protein/permease [Eubacterium sp.]